MSKLHRTLTRIEEKSEEEDAITTWQSGLRIDKHDLDTELEHDASIVHQVGDAFALACSKRDELKLERDETLARLDLQARSQAEAKGTKVTEASIKSAIDLNDDAKDIRRRYLAACTYADRLDVLVRAYYVRASDIRALGELYKSSYFTINNHIRAGEDGADRASAVVNRSKGFGKGASK